MSIVPTQSPLSVHVKIATYTKNPIRNSSIPGSLKAVIANLVRRAGSILSPGDEMTQVFLS
jgi:hypothetical protein